MSKIWRLYEHSIKSDLSSYVKSAVRAVKKMLLLKVIVMSDTSFARVYSYKLRINKKKTSS